MKLFKNVPLEDLESILRYGILPISETGNNNWREGKRANNSIEKVYLFNPLSKLNSFPKTYGVVLLEVDVEASKSEMKENDYYKDYYIEYIRDRVEVENILSIYVPKIFKNRVKKILPEDIFKKIKFVEMTATNFDGEELNKEKLKLFGETANITGDFNYFRGREIFEGKTEIFDVFNIQYKLK